ncbi:MAG: phytanoyl-CoA dioxygenase family protein [Alphaproteobacteria bacterium]
MATAARTDPTTGGADATGPLRAGEVARYRMAGYVTPRLRLPADALARLAAAVDALIEANPQVRPEDLAVPHVPGGAGGRLNTPAALRAEFLAIGRHPLLLEAVAQLIGPDIILWSSHAFCKPAATGATVPWHQDGQYWPIRPMATCTAWIAIDRSDRGNGCLRVIPGSHRDGLLSHRRDGDKALALDSVLDLSSLDAETAEDVVLEPGAVSFHDVHLVHGSEPNRSDRPRRAMVFRYMPATSHYDRDTPDYVMGNGVVMHWASRPIWLVRGRNRHPGNSVEA